MPSSDVEVGRPRAWRRGLAALVAALLVVSCTASATEDGPPTDPDAAAVTDDEDVAAVTDDEDVAAGDPAGDGDGDLAEETAAPPEPATPEPPPVPATREELVADVRALVEAALEEVGDAPLSVLVVDEHDREVVAHEPDRPMLPASTTKLVTAAAALLTLGPNGRLPTTAETTGELRPDGVLTGDLLLVGSGDPVLVTDEYARWVYPARPVTRLSELADAIVDRGVRRIEGDVVGISEAFPGTRVPFGWPDEYFATLDARYVDGLTVDAGLRTIVTFPEPEASDAGVADDAPDAAEGSERGDGGEDDDRGTDDGPSPTDLAALEEELGPPRVVVDHAADPREHAARELIRLLEDRGVEVAGGPGAARRVDRPVTGRLALVHSPTVEELLGFAVSRSDNHISDQLFRLVARTRTGAGSWYRGDRAVRQVLDRLGVDHRDARFADGSGLSREDRLTARLLIDLDRAMQRSQHRSRWMEMMAVTGVRGTLQRRLVGTPGAGRFYGKTGSLNDVNTLVGTVVGDRGQAYHLAVMINDAPGEERWVARQLQDELILRLAEDLDERAAG